ncbi:hypothetical protein D9757_000363 [Collybiopsis confluens]|uniref:MARVEL domain-containing protein n=1 Tax=Collybiopsis confluens TaxID=2823264 RepID=A0A8H5I2A2_9AGAR|nr:hypothetical protein D9757_000363 [Collybiopsis confluens]
MAAFLPILRLTVLIAVLIFSVIVIGLAAHFTVFSEQFFDGYFVFAAMAIAVAALTILTVPVMIAIDFTRKGAFTSMVLVELIWFLILWVLWLAAAALAAQDQIFFFGSSSTSCDFGLDVANTACHEFLGIEAFSFLAWLTLMGYDITLLVYAIIGSTRGTRPWFSTVHDGLLTPREGAAAPAIPAPQQHAAPTGSTFDSSVPTTGYPSQEQQPYAQPQYSQSNQTPMMAQV